MKIAVIGTGYVGLVTGTCFAHRGNEVCCIDINEEKIRMLREGGIPIYEPGLKEIVEACVNAGRLDFTTNLAKGIEGAQLIFVAVGTPQATSGAADLSIVWAAIDALAPLLTDHQIIVIKSTVPVGTNRQVLNRIASRRGGATFEVASNPEFLKEGEAIKDCLNPDRVVVGVRSAFVRDILAELYAPFISSPKAFLSMSPESAEMTKYAANAMLATKISFINEISNLCDLVGADVKEVREGIGSDIRIGPHFLQPGPGYGGSCFPKDVSALIYLYEQFGLASHLMLAVENVNRAQKLLLPRKVRKHFEGNLAGKTIAVWGLAFKPNTDDIRESPAIDLLDILLGAEVNIRVHDPEAMGNIRAVFKDKLTYCEDPLTAVEEADGLVIVTEWKHYRPTTLEKRQDLFAELTKRMCERVIFDGRNIFEPAEVAAAGFTYYPVGRPTVM